MKLYRIDTDHGHVECGCQAGTGTIVLSQEGGGEYGLDEPIDLIGGGGDTGVADPMGWIWATERGDTGMEWPTSVTQSGQWRGRYWAGWGWVDT